MRREGVSDRIIMAITGHQSLEMVKRYDTVSEDELIKTTMFLSVSISSMQIELRGNFNILETSAATITPPLAIPTISKPEKSFSDSRKTPANFFPASVLFSKNMSSPYERKKGNI